MLNAVSSFVSLHDDLHVSHDANPTSIPDVFVQRFDSLTNDKFKDEKYKKSNLVCAQFREVVGVLFPLELEGYWKETLETKCVYLENGMPTLNFGRVDVSQFDLELRACAKMFYTYGLTHATCQLCLDFREVTWKDVSRFLRGVSTHQRRLLILIFRTIPCKVEHVWVYKPTIYGARTILNAGMSIASRKMHSRIHVI